MTPKAKVTKEEIVCQSSSKIKNFALQKTLSRKCKDKPQNQRKYLQIYIYIYLGIISRIHKELLQLNNKRTNKPIKNRQRIQQIYKEYERRYTNANNIEKDD